MLRISEKIQVGSGYGSEKIHSGSTTLEISTFITHIQKKKSLSVKTVKVR
jgi:hypothetical protein